MREVSCRALSQLLKAGARTRVPDALFTEGVPYSIEYLRTSSNRITWAEFCRILRNARARWSLQELSDINESPSPFFSYVGVISRLLFTSRDLFEWIQKRSVGGGAQLFARCVVPSFEHVGADVTVIRLEIREPYEVSEEFFWMTRGAFISLPRMVGAGTADVEMTIDGRVATFRAHYQNKRGTLSAAVRYATWPFTARAAARELLRSNEQLHARFLELEEARARLDRQATQLRTAHVVNGLVQRDLDLDRTLDTIVHALVEQAGFAMAELHVADGDRRARFGTATARTLVRTLATRGGQHLADLEVAVLDGADTAERDELLDFIVPSLALTLETALYRAGLERLVEVRTTELTQARDELAATVDQLRDAQSARQRFFGNISHEFRTPLSIITLAASTIAYRAGDVLDRQANANLDSIEHAAGQLTRLVEELLLLAAAQEDKLELRPEPTDLVALATQLVAAWQPSAEAAGLALGARLPAALVAKVDPIALERVATNLLSNAVKYTKQGRVDLELGEDASGIRLAVLDTGPGISKDLAGRLFGRFERGRRDERRKPGAGLGLALARQLVELHGGTIAAHPRPTGGTMVEVRLPGALVVHEPVAHAAAQLRLEAPRPQAHVDATWRVDPAEPSRGTIVLAEDDPRLAKLVAQLLAEAYTVHVALDGNAALKLVEAHHPQLLITDVDMPGIDGIELARQFREQAGDRTAPVVILSALAERSTRLEGLEAGAVDYITKPFDPLELKARVNAQFRLRELALRLHNAEQLSALGILTAALAHELRNPTNAIINAIPPLRTLVPAEVFRPDTPAGRLLDVIETCAAQLGSVARQMLGVRKDGELEVSAIAARKLVHRALVLASLSLSGVETRVAIDGVDEIVCAPALMTQVLTNLIENAGHAAGAGGWVEIRVRRAGDRIEIEVSDSGPGVPPAHRDRVFDAFFTTKAWGKGTGLGLPLARDIAARHHGRLEIRDHGEKSSFVLELPVESPWSTTARAV